MDLTTVITWAAALSGSSTPHGKKTGDWNKPLGRAKRKRKQKIQKASRKANRN